MLRAITQFLAAALCALAAFGAGAIRTVAGDYRLAFWIAGLLCVLAGASFLTIGRRAFPSGRSVKPLVAAPAG